MCTSIMPPPKNVDPTTEQIITHLNGLDEPDIIIFTGGEPTLRPDLEDLVRYVHNRFPGTPFKLLTNGRMFSYRDYTERIVSAGVDNVEVSLCGPSPAVHDAVTRTPGSFIQSLEGIRNLVSAGVNTNVRYVLHELTYKSVVDVPDLLDREVPGIGQLVVMYMDIIGNALRHRKQLIVPYRDVAHYVELAADVAVERGISLALYHIPSCVIAPAYRHLSAGVTVIERRITYPPQCERCTLRSSCCGVWKTYAKDVGTEEFVPIIER